MGSLGWKCESLRLPSMGSLRIDHVTEPEQCLGRNSWRYWQRQSRRWTFCEVREHRSSWGLSKLEKILSFAINGEDLDEKVGGGALSNTISTSLHRKQRQKFMNSDPGFVTNNFFPPSHLGTVEKLGEVPNQLQTASLGESFRWAAAANTSPEGMEFQVSVKMFWRNLIRINVIIRVVFFRESQGMAVNKSLLICILDVKGFRMEVNFLHCILIWILLLWNW